MTLNWKILFRIYPTKKYLKKIGKATHSVCEKCDKLDDLEHFFVTCDEIKLIWVKVNEIISNISCRNVKLTTQNVLFGINENDKKLHLCINSIISVAKMCISKYKYGQKVNILILLEQELRIRKII